MANKFGRTLNAYHLMRWSGNPAADGRPVASTDIFGITGPCFQCHPWQKDEPHQGTLFRDEFVQSQQ